MKQPLYIHAATAISPQQSFRPEDFLKPLIHTDTARLYALEAPYSRYISPVAIRRMSRIMKITISAAMQCLKEAGITTPDAIITGTGRGGVTDMEVFVKDMIRMDEEAMNPTAFIQSTYNSPNGWIAMQSGCTAYNQTYVHRGCSFELALIDAQMLLAEATTEQNILVGSYDELTEDYFIIRGKRGYWKRESINSASLLHNNRTSGTMGGEGAAFFLVGNQRKEATACVKAVQIVHNATSATMANTTFNLLEEIKIKPEELSLVLTGLNGDNLQSHLYKDVLEKLPQALPVAGFKQFCGEYDTASGFGLWLGTYLMNPNLAPNDSLLEHGLFFNDFINTILIINHFILGNASIIILSRS